MQEMVEAVAERLLDLHCRLLGLYVLQDADSLNWESQHAFFEGQRGSFTVQMWWFYMQGMRNIEISIQTISYRGCNIIY